MGLHIISCTTNRSRSTELIRVRGSIDNVVPPWQVVSVTAGDFKRTVTIVFEADDDYDLDGLTELVGSEAVIQPVIAK